ncbi:ABC transporter substrate-binding protein, partial [Enterococcus faecium]|uniref:ABC transporter substrate-binding protein n=2 Tax=Bacillati TaxID=1783272 RepID=UPI0021C8C4F0
QTIRYEIAPEAQWSDGTPITAQDFGFLYRAMTTTPGVIDAAPYRAISNVRSLDSGKTVEVDFSQRMIYWPVLFRNLLPSHSIEDFGSSLNSGVPASGWRYSFDNFDRARGIVTINRNDRFWGAKPANHDTI